MISTPRIEVFAASIATFDARLGQVVELKFLDTNAAVSGLLWHGNPGKLIDAAQAASLILCASSPLLAELQGALGREKFAKHLQAGGLSATQIFEGYAALTTVVVPVNAPMTTITESKVITPHG